MAEDQKAGKKGAAGSWTGLLEEAGKKLVPVLVTAGSLLGFVAFAGSVAVWTRFSALKVPADQAVNVIPNDELVATGSALLLLFGFFAALALVAVFLIDRGGRATPGMSRGLLLILMAEGAVIVGVEQSLPLERRIAAMELFLLFVAIALWATHVGWFVKLEDDLHEREKNDELPAVREDKTFHGAKGESTVEPSGVIWSFAIAILAGVVATLAAEWIWQLSVWVLVTIGLGTVGLVLLGIVSWLWLFPGRWQDKSGDDPKGGKQEVLFSITIGGWSYALGRRRKGAKQEKRAKQEKKGKGRAAPAPKAKAAAAKKSDDDEKARKPLRLELTRPGRVLVAGTVFLAAVGASLILWQWWITASLMAASLLVAGLWRVAYLSEAKFVWYGLAVFVSIPLLGTLTGLVHNLADPQVQPVALIRETDGPDEAIQGLYVTETSDRIYFANVGAEGCDGTVASHSGRLLWVPMSEVVAMSIGPLQSIDEAQASALEMSYALTPAVETPAGGQVTLTVAEKRAKVDEVTKGGGSSQKQRLESAGPAVRPNFGSGLTLLPEVASPGDVVTLKMSTPDPDVEGFGSARAGHTLRLDGVPLRIVRERALSASEAEYVVTATGRRLALDKEGIHQDEREKVRYVTLEDGAADALDGGIDAPEGMSLRLNGATLAPYGKKYPEVTLPGKDAPIELRKVLVRQAWHEDEIKFRVPAHSSSGVITVECGQLAGQPLLRVAHRPTARIAVQMQAGSGQVLFDSGRSSDDGGISKRKWVIEGAPPSHGIRAQAELPARLGAYSVRLSVTDEDEKVDNAELHLLRLPASSFGFDKDQPLRPEVVERAHEVLLDAVETVTPASIEVDGHADDVGTRSYNLDLSFSRARHVRDALLTGSAAASAKGGSVPVTTLAYGERCPADRRGGRRPGNRRVDVFVLGPDVTVVPAPRCHPGRTETTAWRVPTSSGSDG